MNQKKEIVMIPKLFGQLIGLLAFPLVASGCAALMAAQAMPQVQQLELCAGLKVSKCVVESFSHSRGGKRILVLKEPKLGERWNPECYAQVTQCVNEALNVELPKASK
jgi:hypothetical protein